MTTTRTITAIGLMAMFTLAAVLAACGGGGAAPGPTAVPPETLEPTAKVELDARPTVELIGGVAVRPMVVGPEYELPEGVALLIEIGCTQCDGPVEGIERVYRDASGEMQRESLFSRSTAYGEEPYISSLAVSQDGQTIALTVCSPGNCGGLGPVTEDAATALNVSRDGGTTWDVVDERTGAFLVQSVLADGLVLQHIPKGEYESATYERYPAGTLIEPPEPKVWPMAFGAGELGWRTFEGRLLREDGGTLLTIGEEYVAVWTGRNGLRAGPSGGYAVVYAPATKDAVNFYLAVFGDDQQLTELFALDNFSRVAAWLPSGEPIGTVWFQNDELTALVPLPQFGGASLPAVFDVDAGLLRPITDPFLESLGRNRVLAVVPAP